MVDPRSYLRPIIEINPKLLRTDFRDSNDEQFIEVMKLIKNRVSNHVAALCKEFGASGLADKVK